MSRSAFRIGHAMAVAAALGSGVFAALARPTEAWSQTVTCWAESCSGNVCVRIKIECPNPIKPAQ